MGRKIQGGGTLAISIIMIGFIITPDILWTHAYKYVAPYFIAGYYYAKHKHNWIESNKVGIASAILWLILMPLYSKNTYIYTTGITIFRKENIGIQLLIDSYRYLVGAAGVISVSWILKKLYDAILSYVMPWTLLVKKFIEYMGRNSITFYILSTYLFAWILPLFTKEFSFNFVLTLIETVAVTLLCDAVGRLIKCSKILSRWLIAS